jgi:uncharacterized phage protein (TIGR01671 family)|nr:MAG TPA: YopX protein [Caudoviricetes sp.]
MRKGETMVDRYLFKAKFDDSDRWVKGELVEVNDSYLIIPNHASKISVCWFSASNIIEVKKDTICQCTGLKDKNGNLIWENDIVKDLFSDVYAQIKYGGYQSCFDSTKVEHIGFYVNWFGRYAKSRRKDLGYWINMVDAEIVGNTFDNPELLESGE